MRQNPQERVGLRRLRDLETLGDLGLEGRRSIRWK